MNPSQKLFDILKANGADFFLSVPCKLLGEFIDMLEEADDVIYTPVTREEEGIGICAGAHLAGKQPVILMQNSGLGNSVNAICSLLNYYEIPVIFVVSHRGGVEEKIDAQKPMGGITKELVKLTGMALYDLEKEADLAGLPEFIKTKIEEKQSMVILSQPSYWRGE